MVVGLRSQGTGVALSTLAFDWVYVALVFLLTGGIYLDGWSHATFGPDQSVLSEYHLLFYSSLLALGLWLLGAIVTHRRQGLSGLAALPRGYRLSALGLVIFGVTGVIDLVGHALFGFEADLEALYSPSHIGLFVGWALISLGPVRAALQRRAQGTPFTLGSFLPALLAWSFFFNVLAFVSMEFMATGEAWMLTENRLDNDYLGQVLGIMGIIVQTALTAGSLAWLMLKFKLPRGSLTLFYALFGLFASVDTLSLELLWLSLAVGLSCELLYALIKPNPDSALGFHAFHVLSALSFWGLFYAFVFTTNYGGGIWYTPYIWTGSIVQGAVTALLISLLATAALPSATRTA